MDAAQASQRQPALKRWHIAAVTLGNALAFYDFLTYSFFAIQIGHALFPSAGTSGSLALSLALFFVGFLARPVGAVVIGLYADRAGRRPAMLLSFLLIGVSIAAMALIPPYSAIGIAAPALAIIARLVQGFSLGGEIGSNTAFLLEAAPPETRGLTAAWQGASQNAALLAASIVGIALTSLMPPTMPGAGGSPFCSVRPRCLLASGCAAICPKRCTLRNRHRRRLRRIPITQHVSNLPCATGAS
jgi:MFS transporter, MHS family, citrate/tricarballylate:H+ symporter